MGIDSTERDRMPLIFDLLHECIFLNSSVSGMIITYLDSYILGVGLKCPLSLGCLFGGEAFLWVYI